MARTAISHVNIDVTMALCGLIFHKATCCMFWGNHSQNEGCKTVVVFTLNFCCTNGFVA